MRLIKITGVKEIQAALRKFGKRSEVGLENGLVKGGLLIKSESQRICPIQFGNLYASAAITKLNSGKDTDVIVSYGAEYAVYVHENLDAAHGAAFNAAYADKIANATTPAQKKIWFRRGEEQQAKFLEQPARENKKRVLDIIKREMLRAIK